MQSDYTEWMLQAETDLAEAKKAYDGKSWYVCALLSQQAEEKALKALVMKHTKKLAPKIQ
ncbi:HEPN domain-containing protein [Candidatus Woesearchaeota archaeon]|nr:HEPN domain-containing protein [Candidatus Woesearchaeota archaeon]